MNKEFEAQSKLVLDVLPLIDTDIFALKGGTAINFFYRNLPRLSVDIDLAYLPIENRTKSFHKIHVSLLNLQKSLNKHSYVCRSDKKLDGKAEAKLTASQKDISIKIEPNYILRGSVLGSEFKQVSPKITEIFGSTLKMNCLKFEEIYAGKICAALDRQHPRDLFDIKILLENEGITKELKNLFLFYLMSTSRPFHEILNPRKQPIKKIFEDKFLGMNFERITVNDLDSAYHKLVSDLKQKIEKKDIEFLKSILKLKPNWDLSPVQNMIEFPSIKWRLFNIEKMNAFKREKEIIELDKYFEKDQI